MKKILATLLLFSILFCTIIPAIAAGDKYDLSNFGWKRVDSKGRGSLVFQKAPRGKSMSGHKFYTGNQIYVNLYYRESGYAIAYENGEYGYVDASYIDWGGDEYIPPKPSPDQRPSDWQPSNNLDGTGNYVGDLYVVNCEEWVSLRLYPNTSSDRLAKVPLGAKVDDCFEAENGFYYCEYNGTTGYIQKRYLSSNPPKRNTASSNISSDDRFDLNQFAYRTVVEKGRGKLVFQSSPGGSFMYDYKFYDGDEIYVNLNWRKSGYAIAYKNGTYGYVDASYIDW